MSWKKFIIGEKMPDKDDPAYKEKREQANKAGKTFAETLRLDKAAACVQGFAMKHNKLFLALVFGFVLFSVSLNLYRMCTAVSYHQHPASAIERQEQELIMERHHQKENQYIDSPIKKSQTPQRLEEYEAYRKD